MLLVLDAAYAEYVKRNDYEAGIELVATTQNTVMTRTFSKIHGLAGLRLGWAYCPEAVADVLNRIRGPFNVSVPAMAAGAAAIADKAHEEASVAHNEQWMPWLAAEIGKLGLTVTPSVANFILVHFAKGEAKGAEAADEFLKARGIIVRKVGGYGLPDCLRMTIGTEADNKAVVAALADFVGGRPRMSKPMFERVALIGIGLIGSSISHAMRRNGLAKEIVGSARTKATLDTALKLGLIHKGYDTRGGGGAGRRSRHPQRAGRRLRAAGGGDRPASAPGRHPHRRRLGEGGGRARHGSARAARACTSCRAIRSPAPSSRVPRRASPSCSTDAGPS